MSPLGSDAGRRRGKSAEQRDSRVVLTYRYRAEPTADQHAYLMRCAAAHTAVWNAVVAARRAAVASEAPTADGAAAPHPVRHFSPRDPPSSWLTWQSGTLRFWATVGGVRRRVPYDAVPNVVLRRAQQSVHDAYLSYLRLRRNGATEAKPPGFRSSRRAMPCLGYQTQTRSRAGTVEDWLPQRGPKWALVRVPQPRSSVARISDARVRLRYHRPIPDGAEVQLATWSFDRAGGHWYVSLQCSLAVPASEPSSTPVVVGLDRGVRDLAACVGVDSATRQIVVDRAVQPSPGLTPARRRRLRLLERSVARSHRAVCPGYEPGQRHPSGMCMWRRRKPARARRAEAEIARLRAADARARHEVIEVLTHDLVDGSPQRSWQPADVVAVESLRVKDMMRSARGTADDPGANVTAKAGLNRSIQAASWSRLSIRLCAKAGRARLVGRTVEVVEVDARNTSRTCPECDDVDPANRRHGGKSFACGRCGHRDDADRVAARNIVTRALDLIEGRLAPADGAPSAGCGGLGVSELPPGDGGSGPALVPRGESAGEAPLRSRRTAHSAHRIHASAPAADDAGVSARSGQAPHHEEVRYGDRDGQLVEVALASGTVMAGGAP